MIKSRTGITWMSWPESVEAALLELPGVEQVEVDLDSDIFIVSYDEAQVSESDLIHTVTVLQFGVRTLIKDLQYE